MSLGPANIAAGAPPARFIDAWRTTPPVTLLAAAAAILAFAMASQTLVDVWKTGTFADTDDALRMSQVRDLIAGQPWFDMTARRLDPPSGLFMHWSRIVDVPLVLLVKFFGVFASNESAELCARIVFPALTLFAMLAGLARAAKSLAGPKAIIPALTLCVLAGVGFGQFRPGRIDHHALQIALLVWMLALSLEALEIGRHARAAGAGALAALSLGVSVENLTFIMALSAFWPLAWAMAPSRCARPLHAYGLGMLLALPAVYAATIAPSRWLLASCDAFSLAWFAPALAGAAGCCLLARFDRAASGPIARTVAVVFVGFMCAGAFLAAGSDCLRGLLADVDPLLRSYWLENVSEAKSLRSALAHSPGHPIMTMGPLLICALMVFAAAAKSHVVSRPAWLLTAMLTAAGLATTIWQIRASYSLMPLAILGGVWAILRFRAWLEAQEMEAAAILALALALPLSATGWALADMLVGDRLAPRKAASTATGPAVNCLRAEHFAAAPRLPAGLILAPIDMGAHLIAHSAHSALAGAYHRNNHGNKAAIATLFAPPAEAERLARETRADYIGFCNGGAELSLLRKFAPEGLAAKLADGETPPWLREVSETGAVLRFYKILPESGAAR